MDVRKKMEFPMHYINYRKIFLAILLAGIVITGGWWWQTRYADAANAASNNAIQATGTIEARKIDLAAEIGGKVAEVLVEEGQPVTARQPLVRLDDALLMAQRAVAAAQVNSAKAALASAQTNYDTTLQSALAVEQASTASAWRVSAPNEFNQPSFYFDQAERLDAAQAELDVAKTALDDSLKNLNLVLGDANNADFLQAEKQLAQVRQAYLVADAVKKASDYAGSREAGGLQHASYENYNVAFDALNAAQSQYNKFLNSSSAQTVLYDRAQVAVNQQRYDTAYAQLLSLKTGAQSPAVAAAADALDQAKTALSQAQASLDLLNTQIAKLTISAPEDGTVLTRAVEPGEMALPGATLIEIGRLDRLELTVYLPEEKFGSVKPDQNVRASVDAYPGRVFEGTVLRMSNEAEFTPTNVQTKEDRTRLVYAVTISLDNPDLALKPGMIADVNFAIGGSR